MMKRKINMFLTAKLALIIVLIFEVMLTGVYEVSANDTTYNVSEIDMNVMPEIGDNLIVDIEEMRAIPMPVYINVEIEIQNTIELTIEQRIENDCTRYGIPYNIVLAIARLETGWFKSEAYVDHNNPGGLSINEIPMTFDTIEQGVDAFVFNLANNYFAIGLNTPETIGSKYCPADSNWVILVSEMMHYEY